MIDQQTEDEPGQAQEREWRYDRIANLNCHAHELQTANLYHAPQFQEGMFVPQAYPWMREDHLSRSDELVELLNREVVEAGEVEGPESACVVKQ